MRASTTQRTIAVFAFAIMAVQLMGLMVQHRSVERVLTDRLEQLVVADLQGFAALYEQRRIIAVRQAIGFRLETSPEQDLVLSLKDRDGAQLAGNAEPWPHGLEFPTEMQTGPIGKFSHDGQTFLGAVRVLRGRFPMLVGRNTAELDAAMVDLRWRSAMMFLATMAISIFAAMVANRVVMDRIIRINKLADRVAQGEVTARLPPPVMHDEYALLERHIHGMLDQIEALTRATHQLSDTIAHELRSPLTRIQNRLQNITPQDANVEAASLEMRRTIHIFDSLLQIAKAESEGGDVLSLMPVDLSQLTMDLGDLYAPMAEDKGIVLTPKITFGLHILGDRNLVAQLLSNLLDNAIKFCPHGAEITLSLTTDPKTHCLEVSDNGPGVPDGFEECLFDRFSQARPDGAGHGLGLALVKAIALRHGAKLTLPAVEKGFAIQIHWPKLNGNP